MTGRFARCAIWLLEQFVSPDDAIVGDLVEHSADRSVLWLWRQVLAIVVIRIPQIVYSEGTL